MDVLFWLSVPTTAALSYATLVADEANKGGPGMCCFMCGAVGLIAGLASGEDES